MHVDVHLSKIFRIHTQLTVPAAKETERGLHRFFHHVPDLPGKRDIPFAQITRRFDVQYFAAARRVSQSSDHAGFTGLELCFANVFGRAKHFRNHLRRDRCVIRFSPRDLRRNAATHSSDLTLELTNAGFMRVIADDEAKRVLLEFTLLGFEPVLLQLSRNKISLRESRVSRARCNREVRSLRFGRATVPVCPRCNLPCR